MGEGGVSGLRGPTGRQNLSQATWVSAGGVQGDSNNSFQPLGLVFQQWVRYILKFQLSWKAGQSFLWLGAWLRSLCSLDRLGPQEGPASQTVWPGLKVCSGPQLAARLECGHPAITTDSPGDTGQPPFPPLPPPQAGKTLAHQLTECLGLAGVSAPPTGWPDLTPGQVSGPVGCPLSWDPPCHLYWTEF